MNKKSAIIKFGIIVGLIMIAYIPMFIWMWGRWFEKESYYGHGFLIPIVSLFIVYQRRGALKKIADPSTTLRTSGRETIMGLGIIVVGVLVHLACAGLKLYFVSGFTFVFVLYGAILFAFGKQMTRNLTFPIFFLLTMIPLPLVVIGNLTVRLKLFVAQAATFILNRIGFYALQQGSVIKMQSSVVLIEAPCSGLRSLISLLTLGLIFAYAMKVSYVKKTVLFLSSIPIAIVTNMIRILALCIVTELYGEKAAMGIFHDLTGYAVFGIAFFLLMGVGQMLEGRGTRDEG